MQSVDLAGGTLAIAGVPVRVTPDTQVHGRRPSTLADVKPGINALAELSVTGSALFAQSMPSRSQSKRILMRLPRLSRRHQKLKKLHLLWIGRSARCTDMFRGGA